MKLTAEELTGFLMSISVMLFLAKVLGEFFSKFRQPAIIGEILAGIVLGPTVLGTFFPNISAFVLPATPSINLAMDGITSLAVIMLLLISGLEVDLAVVVRQSKTAFFTSFMGIVFPFLVGFSLAYLFPEYLGIQDTNMHIVFALFMGTAMSISALPVIARTLMDLNIFRTEIGLVIIASAMFDDLIGWIIFSIILGTLGTHSQNFSLTERIGFVFIFLFFMLFIGRKIINKALPYIQKYLTFPGGVLNFIFILGFLCAAFTEYIGIHAIFGAFIVGVTIGDSAHLKEKTREIINQFVTNIFAPLFFVSIGLHVNFLTHFDPLLVLIILAIAFIGKVFGCGLGSYWGGMNKNEALAIGFGMNSRGAMEIIIGLLALQAGLIQEKVFVALVIMALFTSMASSPIMNYFLSRKKKFSFNELLDKQLLFFTESPDKKSVIRELVEVVARKNNLNPEIVFEKVWQREEAFATGIANSLAIPHARILVNKPIIAIAVHRSGIDFDAADNLPARIIILLLTPISKNELQLQLLAEIADKFANKTKADEIVNKSKLEDILLILQH